MGDHTLSNPSAIWVIGCGKMGEAFLRGAHAYFSGMGREKDLLVIEPADATRERVASLYAVSTFSSVEKAIENGRFPEIIFLAVKPDRFLSLAGELKRLSSPVLAISVMAGITLALLERHAPEFRWVRTMSNLALTTGEGMTLIAPGSTATSSDERLVLDLFSRMGKALILEEKDFDIATALAGSGPGLMALVGDALVDAGVLFGLKRETASLLVAQMFLGTGTLLLSGCSPSELKGYVSSPGGTTIEGIASLEDRAVRGAFIESISATVKKSRQLSGDPSGSAGAKN
ncbi:pyrroline-5-carboxylate reductase [Leptospirillum ferrooxidans]|uniref:Pyrroline-5-carboxylate reductase n=1 Tax=Leptospirillum ferrooxidans (strain C2-3) TaxID=1162668 RepID=I0IQA8_LEPFC|nr:pyrroline-5-carboxylate reductase [Leptospirillum ferrooxidans]BAM07457.1 putative pyrroline-5-carboxylate reductase [Leptospirillum ferrooxidans C2-3]